MKRVLAGLLFAATPAVAQWTFTDAVPVSGNTAPNVFAHLESAGRRAIAVHENGVALVWEDNRNGTPQAYLALKPAPDAAFRSPQQLSTGAEAYEPVIAAVSQGFVAAWEQDGNVHMRVVRHDGLGPVQRLDDTHTSQVTLHAAGDRLFAAWAAREKGPARIIVAPLSIADDRIRIGKPVAADAVPAQAPQLYPSLAHAGRRLVVAWEDRRAGHTRLFYACTSMGDALTFSKPMQLNETPPARSEVFGRGTGVTRVALADNGAGVTAVWMDKRDFQGGYDIYAARLEKACRFGTNEKVQDMFGENTPQWHPTVAMAADGTTAAVWDDPRDGTPDLWLSQRGRTDWRDDIAVEPAHGPGRQDNPAILFDTQGRLHIVWLHAAEGEPVRVMYAVGTR